MEAPRFIKNKTFAFSSAFLALTIAACGGGEIAKDDKTPTPVASRPTPQEKDPSAVNAEVIIIDNTPVLAYLTLDQSCGVSLAPGGKTTIKILLDNNPNGNTVDFDLEFIKDPEGKLYFASQPAKIGQSIALVNETKQLIPLGSTILVAQDQIFFAFFEERKFKVPDCAVDNPELH